MKPLLAHTYEPHRVTYPCYVQPKLNGIRALYQAGNFQSRDELPFPTGLLSHLAQPLLQTFGPETILDGELYVHGWPLQRINAAVTPVRQRPTEDTLKVEYHVFDQVRFDQTFDERHAYTQTPIGHLWKQVPGVINRVLTAFVVDQKGADQWYSDFVADGYEGMMYRLGDCPYTIPKQHWAQAGPMWQISPRPRGNFLSDKNNRCWHLLKRKDWHDDEFVCTGVQQGEGKYIGMTGALVCKTPTGKHFTVSGGLSDPERVHYWENPPLGETVKVKFLVYSVAGIPLNPQILAIL